ncbi:hypothetical protein AB5J56_00630 [Streptomyces sp. R21]|uniref:Uncharacterized protein n=1 Tax=Streptomyces sp. R21 TaxID=3238627 RepID=A0AB39P2K1_9ACTN
MTSTAPWHTPPAWCWPCCPQTQTRDPRSFVDPSVWDRQITLLVRDHPFDRLMAERLFGQAVAYLITAMETWGQGLEIGCGALAANASLRPRIAVNVARRC